MNAHPPELNPAAGKPGKPLNVVCLRRPEHADAVVAQIAFIIESSGITVIARRMKLRANLNARPVGKWRDGRPPRPACAFRSIGVLYFLVNRQPHSSPHRPSFAPA